MMKKRLRCIAVMLCCVGALLILPGTARATDTLTLDYEQIAPRVEQYNSSVRVARLALEAANNALRAAREEYREQKEQGESPGRAAVQNEEQSVETQAIKYAQTTAQIINAAQQLFIRSLQLEQDVAVRESSLAQAQKAVERAETRLLHGLGAPAALTEAEAQGNAAQAELDALLHQHQALLMQLGDMIGLKTEEYLVLGAIAEPDAAYAAQADPERDAEQAIDENFDLRLLHVERSNTFATNAKRRVALQIEQQKLTIRQTVTQKHHAMREAESKLQLAEAELARSEQQLQAAETSFSLGRISQAALENQHSDHIAKQAARRYDQLALLWAIEDYQATLAGI